MGLKNIKEFGNLEEKSFDDGQPELRAEKNAHYDPEENMWNLSIFSKKSGLICTVFTEGTAAGGKEVYKTLVDRAKKIVKALS